MLFCYLYFLRIKDNFKRQQLNNLSQCHGLRVKTCSIVLFRLVCKRESDFSNWNFSESLELWYSIWIWFRLLDFNTRRRTQCWQEYLKSPISKYEDTSDLLAVGLFYFTSIRCPDSRTRTRTSTFTSDWWVWHFHQFRLKLAVGMIVALSIWCHHHWIPPPTYL